MLVADPTSKEIRRFLTGPKGCVSTGVIVTPDRPHCSQRSSRRPAARRHRHPPTRRWNRRYVT
jgi:hypothetical protein